MKRFIAILVLATVLMLPALSRAENHPLTDEYLDSIHAKGLQVFLDFNVFFADFNTHSSSHTNPVASNNDMPSNITVTGNNDIPDSPDASNGSISDSFNNIHVAAQQVGDNNTGNVLQSSVQLNGNAQQNLNSLVNINAASSVIPFGINITIIQGDNYGTVNQRNLSLGMFRSSLFMLGGI